jgi:hypothetical protein
VNCAILFRTVPQDFLSKKTHAWGMRRIQTVALLAGLSTGCSALFMERTPAGFDPSKSEPRCTATKGFVAWDSLQAVGWALTSLVLFVSAPEDTGGARDDNAGDDYITIGVLGIGMSIAHIASATKGSGWANDCKLVRERRERYVAENPPVRRTDAAPVTAPVPRGFYCASNATTGTCARDKLTCEGTRGALLVAASDLSVCTLVESAWCFDEGRRCTPDETMCVAQRQAVGWRDDACVEAR